MNDIRGYLIGTIWTFLSLLVPIRDFMIAMMVLFGLNLVFGIVAAVFNGENGAGRNSVCSLSVVQCSL